jgi:hypothetical protein
MVMSNGVFLHFLLSFFSLFFFFFFPWFLFYLSCGSGRGVVDVRGLKSGILRAFTVGSTIEPFGSIVEPNNQKHAPAGSTIYSLGIGWVVS